MQIYDIPIDSSQQAVGVTLLRYRQQHQAPKTGSV